MMGSVHISRSKSRPIRWRRSFLDAPIPTTHNAGNIRNRVAKKGWLGAENGCNSDAQAPAVVMVKFAVPLPFASSVTEFDENEQVAPVGRPVQARLKAIFASTAPPEKASEYWAD
jgi:hypothetical protein